MDPKAARRLLLGDDPLRDGEPLATRLLGIDEAERVREALREAGIVCQLRLIRPGEVAGSRRDPLLDSAYSVLRPSWNVVVAAGDLAKARATAESATRTDLDGRADTADVAEGRATPSPVPLVVMAWDEAWDLVQQLGRSGVRAAVGAPFGDDPLERSDVPVLVLPEDVERALALVPREGELR